MGHHCRRERPRTGPWWKPQESRVFPQGSALPVHAGRPWSAAPSSSPRKAVESAGRKGSGSRLHGVRGTLWRGAKAQESIDPSPLRRGDGTDPRGEQGPGAAGHRDLLVLRAGARDARNGKRATASKGVRLREGETLCRANPMSGTGPSGPESDGGRKPSRGWKTLKAERTGCGNPGTWTSPPTSL